MPKLVDHDARRREIAEAVWRVVRERGLEGASVRNVAAEAGLSAGAMRHYFDGQADLQRVAMRYLVERVARRLRGVDLDGDPLDAVERVLLELLPLDPDRQAEAEVWFAFVAQARTAPALRPEAEVSYDALRGVMRRMVELLLVPSAPASGATAARSDEQLELEAERLFALVDGLVLHAVQRPDGTPPGRIEAVVRRHLEQLVAARG